MEYIYSKNDEPIISLEEQEIIVNWVRNNFIYFKINGFNRWFQQLDFFNSIPDCMWKIKERIIEKENLYNYQQEPMFRDSIGYIKHGGELHLHKDPNPEGGELFHTRFNIYVQLPIKGGFPIYDDVVHNLKERTYICCRAGIDLHKCVKVEGNRERIVLSFGFLLPYDRIANVKYDYN
jgi:hypothetical protein